MNSQYLDDIRYVTKLKLPWELLQNSSILISGASGQVGSCLIDVLMLKNKEDFLNCSIYALTRNENTARIRFDNYWGKNNFFYICHDINKPIACNLIQNIDYVLHLASNTHPVAYATDPIGTVTTNIIGTYNMLEFAVQHHAKRFLFASSNEIYGENRGDTEFFDEAYCGYIDSNTMRAGYPESKRCGESLCQAYQSQNNLEVVIPRLTRTYGPTMLKSDTKAISQFILNGLAGENIVLKSEGMQYYSYTYVADAVAGLLTVLLKGKNGEAYNIADESCDITLRDLAHAIAEYTDKDVVFELPEATEKQGYSTATKARLNGQKLKALGWNPHYNILAGVRRTLDILKETGDNNGG